MSALFFVLGVVAKMNASMWRYRINFVPINVVLIGVIVVSASLTFDSALDGVRNSSNPVRVTLEQIHDNAQILQNYVTVSGVDIPVAVYEHGTQGSNGEIETVDESWSPLLDRENHRILLVQKSGKLPGGDPREVTVTGMLRAIDSGLRESLASQKDVIDGVPVETRYVLVADERPGDATTNVVMAAILFGIVGLFAVATAMRNTIFQPTGRIPKTPGVTGAEPIRVGATGTFALDQSGNSFHQRFINMPAVLAQRENGNAALFSNIDASNRFMGITTSRRAGIWTLPIEAGSVRNSQVGFLYWGVSRRQALRFSYTDAVDRTQRRAIITVENEETLGAAMALLPSAG